MNTGKMVPFHPELHILLWMSVQKFCAFFTVAVSQIDNMAVTLHRPQLSQIPSNHLYLSYNAGGPGHYDGTTELTQKDIER